MGKSSPSSQTVTQTTQYPQWVQNAAQRNLNAAYQVSGNMLNPYSGQRVADYTPGQLSSVNAIQQNLGSTAPQFAFAQNAAADMTGYNPAQVNAGSLSGTDLSSYMNPYTQNVIQSGLNAIDLQRQQSLNQIGDQALRTGAFAGSRQGIQEGITNAAAGLQAGQLASQLQSQNFAQAQAAAQNDINRNLQAQIANQQAGLSGANLNLNAANSLGALADQGNTTFLKGAGAALAAQEGLQAQNQKILDAQRQYYTEQQQFPLQQLQIPLQALGATPYGGTSTQTGPANLQSSPLLTGLGAASTGVGILQGLSALGVFSDRNMKTDIKKVGRDPETDLNIYSYRYKGDPKSYPKVVGPMAQDIEKKYPDQVKEVNGHKVVNLGFYHKVMS